MNLTIEFKSPEVKSAFDWQLLQEINVKNEQGEVIAKAEIELITLNKHRGANKSYALIEAEDESTDWELPLNLYFKGQNISHDLCKQLEIIADVKKAQTHMLIEAISVKPEFRNQGVAKYLLQEISKQYSKIQSITLMSMPLSLFVDANECETQESKTFYQQLDLPNEKITRLQLHDFFSHCNFIEYKVDGALLHEPLAFDLFITTPDRIIAL